MTETKPHRKIFGNKTKHNVLYAFVVTVIYLWYTEMYMLCILFHYINNLTII